MPAELAFSADDLARTRFAVSPMWEACTSFKVLVARPAHPVHQPWIADVRPRLAAAGLDRGWLAELIHPGTYVPDFLNPAPGGPAPDLDEELNRIVATPGEQVRADLDRLAAKQGRLGPRAGSLRARPSRYLPRLTEEIRAYADRALAPYWSRVRAVLEADIAYRARRIAEQGAVRVLNDLHADLAWRDNALRLGRRRHPLARASAGAGLLLIPSAFTGPGPLVRVTPPDPPQVAYPARGTGTLWEARPAAGTGAIVAVLGRTRARLLAELSAPASTTDLAARTGISAAGASQNLTALRDAGLVSAHRAGRSVLYARTAVADALLAAQPGQADIPESPSIVYRRS